MTSAREVAEISFEVAPIWVAVAAVPVAVACCCLEVAAISVNEEFSAMPDFCTSPTSFESELTIRAKALPMTSWAD